MGTIASGRGAGLEKYSLCGGACHSRPGPRRRAGLCRSSCKALAEESQGQNRDPWVFSNSPNSHSPGVTVLHSPDPVYSAVFLTVNVQLRVCITQAQTRLENDPSLCASLCTPGRPGYTLLISRQVKPKVPQIRAGSKSLCHGLKRRLLRPSRSFENTPCGVRPARAARNIHEWLQTPRFRSPKQHPPGPGTCRSSQYSRSCTWLAHPPLASPHGHVQHRFPRASRQPLPFTRHEHSPRVCSGTSTRALCRGTLARTLTSVLAQGPLAGIPTCSSKHTGQSRGAQSPSGEPPADAICLPIGARICGGKCCIRWRAHLLCAL